MPNKRKGSNLDTLYREFVAGKRRLLPVPYVNKLLYSVPARAQEKVLARVFKTYYKINKKLVDRCLSDYKNQQQNLTTQEWSPKTHARFAKPWKDAIWAFLCGVHRRLVQDVVVLIIEFVAPPPLTPAQYEYVYWRPFFFERAPDFYFFSKAAHESAVWKKVKEACLPYLDEEEKVWDCTRNIIQKWKKRRLFGHVWEGGWEMMMFRRLGPGWKKHPAQMLFILMHHIANKGLGKYGGYELNVLTQALFKTWGRTQTLDFLYKLWAVVAPHDEEIAEGPLSDMLCKCTILHSEEEFSLIKANFTSLFSASYLRFLFV